MTSIATTSTSLQSAAEQLAAANALSTSASSSGSSSTGSASSSLGTNALQSLAGNFNQFLSLLTTQLQNQDPTSPMDTNQFTEELVQFTGVQQSVETNSNLSQLISLTQGSEVLQSANITGDSVTVTSPQLALQSGQGTISFNAPSDETVQVAIANSSGQTVLDTSISATAGSNSWTWNGQDNNGNQLADGAYGIALETGASGASAPVTFSVLGTATGLQNSSSGLQLDVGALQLPVSALQSVQQPGQ
jgi:flagellar basal-body rod modification protein FlgD